MMKRPPVFLLFLLVCALALLVTLWADPALAQASGSAGNFSCSGSVASGSLYESAPSCPTKLRFESIFSFLVCNIEQLSGNILGHMYCGMAEELTPAVRAALVLVVIFFGMGFTIGLIPATGREAILFMLKISAVWAFATQSDYMIGVGYKFFITGIPRRVAIALSNAMQGVDPNQAASVAGPAVYGKLDELLAEFIHYGTDYLGLTENQAGMSNDKCKNAVFAALVVMAAAFPPIFFIALVLIVKIVMTFLRAVFAYIYCLVGIAFLMTLAPFFMTFFLFKPTKPYFDKWVGYMASFAMQVVLLFVFLSFILSLKITGLTDNFKQIIVPMEETFEATAFRTPLSYCTICDFEVQDEQGKTVSENDYGKFLGKAKLTCKKDANGNVLKLSIMNAVSPPAEGEKKEEKDAKPKDWNQATATSKAQQNALMKFAGGGLMALLVLAFVVESLLTYVGSLAAVLAGGLGGYYAPQLGGGRGRSATLDVPGKGYGDDFAAGFESGFMRSGNSMTGLAAGLKEGMGAMVNGGDFGSAGKAAGMKDRFAEFISNPNRLER